MKAYPEHLYLIIPVYNEAKVIRSVLLPLLQAGLPVILVDDASTDDLPRQVDDLPIYRLRHRVNLGQGAALETGMAFARQLGAKYVIHFDADGQHRLADIPAILAPLLSGEADVSLGSRFLQSESRALVPWRRRLLLKMATWVNGLFTGLWLSDAHNGLRALNQTALEKIRLSEPRMAHATEILAEIHRHRLMYVEVPVQISYSDYAQQKGQSAWGAFHILSDLILRKIFPL